MTAARKRNLPANMVRFAPGQRRIGQRRETIPERPPPLRPRATQIRGIRRGKGHRSHQDSAQHASPSATEELQENRCGHGRDIGPVHLRWKAHGSWYAKQSVSKVSRFTTAPTVGSGCSSEFPHTARPRDVRPLRSQRESESSARSRCAHTPPDSASCGCRGILPDARRDSR